MLYEKEVNKIVSYINHTLYITFIYSICRFFLEEQKETRGRFERKQHFSRLPLG